MDLLIGRRRRSLHGAILALVAVALMACAHGGDREEARPPERPATTGVAGAGGPAGAGSGATADSAPARVVDRDAVDAVDRGADSAARRASDRAVEEGKGYLIAGQPGEAARRFERATRIDPTNGFAWYHLGRARVEQGDVEGAIGVLEKATSLLGPYPDWRGRAERLLSELDGRG